MTRAGQVLPRDAATALIEAGLAELREGQRQAERRKAFLEARLAEAERGAARRRLAAHVAARAPAKAWAARAEGPLGTARALMRDAAAAPARRAARDRDALALTLAQEAAAVQEEARVALAALAADAWRDADAVDLPRAARFVGRASAARGEGGG
ncbi:MAG: hypothetical protein AAF192_00900, partial [Pseudomonadota bacterium]